MAPWQPGLLDVFKPLVNQVATDWASCEAEQANESGPLGPLGCLGCLGCLVPWRVEVIEV